MNDFINDILRNKEGNLFNNLDNELEFSPYIIQRILSMNSFITCNILNHTTNGKFKFLDKKQIYKLWVKIIPPSNKFVETIKRSRKTTLTEIEEKVVDFLAQKHKISKREVEEYIKELNLNTGDIVKLFK